MDSCRSCHAPGRPLMVAASYRSGGAHRLAHVHDDLLARRSDYPILERCTYLVSHSLGAMHRETRDRLGTYTDEWATRGVVAWEHWIVEMARIADVVGSIIGAPPGATVMRANVASALADLASPVDLSGPRHRTVSSSTGAARTHH